MAGAAAGAADDAGPCAAEPFDPAPIDDLLAEAVRTWKTPGMAVVIVRDDEVIYLKGHGVRRLGKTEPVMADTIFGIGSLTKAMTATGIGLLVDDGKMSWDDPVRKHPAGPVCPIRWPTATSRSAICCAIAPAWVAASNSGIAPTGPSRRRCGGWRNWSRPIRSGLATTTAT